MSSTTLQDTSRIDPGVRLVGQTIDKYRVVRLIGRGGMGRVYEAVNTTIKKRVAIKLIDTELAKNEEANARFQREALAASSVESPYIVQIFDAGSTREGVPYIVMELLRGRDLRNVLSDSGRLPVDQALLVAAQVLKGLHHAHAAGIVHRDLKPDNVFLVEREDEPMRIKLLDFGVSKIARAGDSPLKTLTRQGTVVGTPYYMSPEQAQAFPDVDGRTDIYSLGAILYEALAGRPPIEGKTYEQVIVNICVHDVENVRTFNPDVPEGIAQLIHKALSRERADRFPDARAMLEAIAEHAPESLRRGTPSAELRISAKPGSNPPRVAATPITAKVATPELADTVNVESLSDVTGERPDSLLESGISAKSGGGSAPELYDGEDEATTLPSGRRRWALAVAPGVALLVAVLLVMRFSGGDEEGATHVTSSEAESVADQPTQASTAEVETEPTARVTSRGEPEASASASASALAIAPPSTARPPAPPVAPLAKPPVAAAPKSTSVPEPKPEPKPEPTGNPGLELLPR
jgi:serine/threonine-protein kinase